MMRDSLRTLHGKILNTCLVKDGEPTCNAGNAITGICLISNQYKLHDSSPSLIYNIYTFKFIQVSFFAIN